MCGIAGIFEYATGATVAREDIHRMTAAIHHRGPDGSGTYCSGGIGLGMRRLSIIDVSRGGQPMTNEDGRVVVVFNGEIYNYAALRAVLRGRGHHFGTDSDTEVIPHLYESRGDDFVDELRGMFGLAVWDADRQRLVLARDRLGIKPLYFFDDGRRLVFASEIKALLRHPQVQASIDPIAVNQYLALRYVPSPRTMFVGIQSLQPGTALVCDAGGIRTRRYWDIPAAPGKGRRRGRDLVQELSSGLRESVSLHLRSDVPFGAFLSGGLDSSTVVALMSETLNEPVRTYSVGFVADGRLTGELAHAAVVAEHFGTDHHELVMGGADFVGAAQRLVWHLDQPLADVATIPMLLLAEHAARDVKMVLSGEGGDELFGGYARHVGERYAGALRFAPYALRSPLADIAWRHTHSRRWNNVLEAMSCRAEAERLAGWFPLLAEDLRHELTSDDLLLEDTATSAELFAATLAGGGGRGALGRMLYCDTKLWLPDLLLARADKVTMAASLELRVPLLDHQLVEFASAIPSSRKVRGLTRKWLLRQVARELLPPGVLERKKEGFPVPVGPWFRAEARDLVRDSLTTDTVRRRGLLEPDRVERLIVEHESGRVDHAFVLWALVGLELWMRTFIDGGATGEPAGISDARDGQPATPQGVPTCG